MKLKNLGQAAFVFATAAAFVIGSAGSSEAAKKKKAEAAPAPASSMYCWGASKPVCATRGGMKFTYANSCYAANDGAKVASQGACKAPKAMKSKGKPAMKKATMKKPAMKKDTKKK